MALVKAWCRADILPCDGGGRMVQAGVQPILPTWDMLTRKATIIDCSDVVFELVRHSCCDVQFCSAKA